MVLDPECSCSPSDGVSLSVSGVVVRAGRGPVLSAITARLRPCAVQKSHESLVTLADQPERPPGGAWLSCATVVVGECR
jgi:hypothetical protein